MKEIRFPRSSGVFGRVALRAMEDAFYEREIDACWAKLRKVFKREDVRAAEAPIMRALAESFFPPPPGAAKSVGTS